MIQHPVYDPFPKYLQIREVLLRWLADFAVGDMLPTEQTLTRQFDVSRMTIREALKSLENDGLIARRAGKGTWLARTVPAEVDRRATGPIEDFMQLGMDTSTVLVSTGLVPASPEVANAFRKPQRWEVLEAQRLRFVDGKPFLLLKAYFPPRIGKKVADISHSGTLYVPTLKAVHDEGIREDWQRIEAVQIDETLAEVLQTRTGDPALVVKRLFVDSRRNPVIYFVTIFRADRYYYTVKLAQPKRPRPEAGGNRARKPAERQRR